LVNLHLDRTGRLWISTTRGMACVKDGARTAFGNDSGWVGDFVRAFAEGPAGQLYATTFDGHMIRFHGERADGGMQVCEELPRPLGSVSDGVYPHLDEAGALWVVTPHFIGRLVGRRWEETIPRSVWAGESLEGMAPGRDGSLYRLYGGRFAAVPQVGPVRENRVVGLLADPDGTLWLAFERDGALGCLRDGRLTSITTTNGLPPLHSLFPLVPNAGRNLWIACDQGIVRVPRDELEEVVAGRRRALAAQLFTKEDGLPTKDCSPVNQPLAATDPQGRLWFPTIKGLVMVEPRRLQLNPAPPVLVIDKVLLDGMLDTSKKPLLTSSPPEPGTLVIPPAAAGWRSTTPACACRRRRASATSTCLRAWTGTGSTSATTEWHTCSRWARARSSSTSRRPTTTASGPRGPPRWSWWSGRSTGRCCGSRRWSWPS
jgi:ligand-binding sensor domain-containing protein